MYKETYERLSMDVTKFDVEDVIVTSGEQPVTPLHTFQAGTYELPVGIPSAF